MSLEATSPFFVENFISGFDPQSDGEVAELYRAVLRDPDGTHHGPAAQKFRAVALLTAQRKGFDEKDLVSARAFADPNARVAGQSERGPIIGIKFEFRRAAQS